LLIEKYDLEIVLSTKDLLRKHRSAKQNTAVLIGNPKFDVGASRDLPSQRSRDGTPKTAYLTSQSLPSAVPPPSACRNLPPGGVLCPLPGTESEVNNIFSQLKKANWQAESPYTGEKATKLVMMQARHPRLLHVATHAFFKKEEGERSLALEDPMLRSGLFFAGADRVLKDLAPIDGDSDNGVLTAYEATSLHLEGTELVVLSACETGQGEVRNGEGVFGLRRALQEAGAESVLMSMWPVPDKETEKLMTTFYEKWLLGEGKHQALREAQLELRERVKDSNEGKDVPYYWGAFVLVGH